MRRSLQCPSCGGRKIWNLRGMMEHAGKGQLPLGEPQGLSPMEVFICDGCGHAEWYAQQPKELEPQPGVVELNDHRFSCRDCGGREHLLVARFEEASRRAPHKDGSPPPPMWYVPLAVAWNGDLPVGTFAVTACRSCGLLNWFACGASVEIWDGSCFRCGSREVSQIERVEEVGGDTLPLQMRRRHELGHFRLEVCGACGYTRWIAEGYSALRPDGDQVRLLEGKGEPVGQSGPQNPYR